MSKKHCITTAMIGEVFARLTVIGYGHRNHHNQQYRVCRCCCGAEVFVLPGHLRDGTTKSCGCLERDVLAARNAATIARAERVGRYHRGHPRTYASWRAMIYRCENEKCRDYPRYGGRGVEVCDRWHSYPAFLADMGPRPPRTTIDRIDVEGNYEPGNCRWASARTQGNNRRRHRLITRNGVTKTLAQWVAETDQQYNTVLRRLKFGWDVERAITTPA